MSLSKYRVWDKESQQLCNVGALYFSRDYEVEIASVHLSNDWVANRSVDDCVLMQSTGLKDKNGVEIFEGDICKIQRIPSGMKPIFVVSDYIKEKLIFSKITILGQNSYEEQGGYTGNFLEVIGNRFENQELLEAI